MVAARVRRMALQAAHLDARRKTQTMKSRGSPTEEKPFVWVSAKAMSEISNHADQPGTARSVYMALCEISSVENSPTFRRTVKRIAGQAGFAYSATHRAIRNLATIGLISVIDIERRSPKRNAGCVFSILTTGKVSSQRTNQLVHKERTVRSQNEKFGTDRETRTKEEKNGSSAVGEESENRNNCSQKPYEEMTGEERGKYFRRLQTEAHAREWEASSNE